MGTAFILFSVLSNIAKACCSKKIAGEMGGLTDSVRVNLIQQLLSFLLGLGLILFPIRSGRFALPGFEWLLMILSGLFLAGFSICWMLALKSEAYMLASASSASSIVVPCAVGVIMFGEKFTPLKIVAVLCFCGAIFFMQRYNGQLKGKIRPMQALCLGGIVLFQGIYQSLQKVFAMKLPDENTAVFTLGVTGFTALFLLFFAVAVKGTKGAKTDGLIRGNLWLLVVMALANYAKGYFQTLAAGRVEAIVLFPLISALNLIGASIFSSVLFKEKITANSLIGVAFTLAGVVIFKFA